MSEIDYDELEKEMGKVMADDDGGNGGVIRKRMEAEEEGVEASDMHAKPRPAPLRRGRYMDMVHPTSDMRPPLRNYSVGKDIKAPERIRDKIEEVYEEEDEPEFGVVENVNSNLSAEEDFVAKPGVLEADFEEFDEEPFDDGEPDANNYSLGGKSPFIPDAKVEKRPLGDDVPESNARSVQSTKNVYSQRTPLKQDVPDVQTMVVGAPKKSGWIWAIVTILVILIGAGLGVLAFVLYTNQ